MRSHNSINDYAFTKKININIKNLYNFTFEFFGNINTLENHIHFIKYPEKLLINNYYFITRNNKKRFQTYKLGTDISLSQGIQSKQLQQ